MPEQFIVPKTYMIIARRASTDTTFCELTGVKNSLGHWRRWGHLSKTNQPYLVYKFNARVAAYELKFDGQQAADLFLDDISDRKSKDVYNVIVKTLL